MEHTCHATNCKRVVPPKMFMCKSHWYKLPATIRSAVWREYVPDQEITKTPTTAYLRIAQHAISYIEKLEAV